MAANHPLVLRLVASSLAISRRVGKIITDITKGGQLGIVDKGVNDFQTQADRSAQRCIVTSLTKLFPKVTIIGEEDLEPVESINSEWIETGMDEDVLKQICPDDLKPVQEDDVVVWVDPLDGTAEYTQGLLDHITVLIGVAHKGRPVGAVIYQPYYNYQAGPDAAMGRAVWGIVGLGVFGIDVIQCKTNTIVTTRSHSSQYNTDAVEACKASHVLKVGGSGHKVLLVLEGLAKAYVYASLGTKKWDTCAPEAIIEACGGSLTDVHGNKLDYKSSAQRMNSAGVVATLTDHQDYIDYIPDSVKQGLLPSQTK